jgi:hypothetical protein
LTLSGTLNDNMHEDILDLLDLEREMAEAYVDFVFRRANNDALKRDFRVKEQGMEGLEELQDRKESEEVHENEMYEGGGVGVGFSNDVDEGVNRKNIDKRLSNRSNSKQFTEVEKGKTKEIQAEIKHESQVRSKLPTIKIDNKLSKDGKRKIKEKDGSTSKTAKELPEARSKDLPSITQKTELATLSQNHASNSKKAKDDGILEGNNLKLLASQDSEVPSPPKWTISSKTTKQLEEQNQRKAKVKELEAKIKQLNKKERQNSVEQLVHKPTTLLDEEFDYNKVVARQMELETKALERCIDETDEVIAQIMVNRKERESREQEKSLTEKKVTDVNRLERSRSRDAHIVKTNETRLLNREMTPKSHISATKTLDETKNNAERINNTQPDRKPLPPMRNLKDIVPNSDAYTTTSKPQHPGSTPPAPQTAPGSLSIDPRSQVPARKPLTTKPLPAVRPKHYGHLIATTDPFTSSQPTPPPPALTSAPPADPVTLVHNLHRDRLEREQRMKRREEARVKRAELELALEVQRRCELEKEKVRQRHERSQMRLQDMEARRVAQKDVWKFQNKVVVELINKPKMKLYGIPSQDGVERLRKKLRGGHYKVGEDEVSQEDNNNDYEQDDGNEEL